MKSPVELVKKIMVDQLLNMCQCATSVMEAIIVLAYILYSLRLL